MAPTPLQQLSSASLGSTFHTPLSTSIAGSAALWWPCKVVPTVVLLFIPGNPGLSSYYTQYLSSIHHQLKGKVEIIALSHRGHCSLPNNERAEAATSRGKGTSLQEQVQVKIQAIDKIRSIYPKSNRANAPSPDVKLLLVGHSVGAWIALECLKQRPNQIDSIHALFPTISWISKTPNAKRLKLLLQPVFPSLFLAIPLFFISFLPFFLLIPLIRLLTFQSSIAARSTAEFITTKGAVRNSLRMAREEMNTIKAIQPDVKFEVSKFTDSSPSGAVDDDGDGDARSLRFYWSREEEDSWAPKWLRHQVEDELNLKRTSIPVDIMNPASSGTVNGANSIGKAKSFIAGSPLVNRTKHQSKRSDSSFFPPISKIDYNSHSGAVASAGGSSSSVSAIIGNGSTIVSSPSSSSPLNLPTLSNNVNVYAQGRSPSMSLGHKRKSSLVAATATRGLDGTIQIETETDPFVSSDSSDDDEVFISGNGLLSKAKGKGKGEANKRINRNRLTSTVCTIGMPHAFCLDHGEPMAKITSYWIKEDLL